MRQRIEELHAQSTSLESEIHELEQPPDQRVLPAEEFELLCQKLICFPDCIDQTTVEQKRAGFRTLVQKVLWDGVCAHVFLLGAKDNAALQDSACSPEDTLLREDSK